MFTPFFMNEQKYRELLLFQKETTEEIYKALSTGYIENENEVKLVERIVTSSSGRGSGRIYLFGKKIHGKASYVSFLNKDKPATTELGDLIVISLVVRNQSRLMQKISIIQNKKATERENGKCSWGVDENQLFLLKNFPKIRSKEGIFKNLHFDNDEIVFPNQTNCLGSYGLLKSPGEMIFATASLIEEFRKGKKSINEEDVYYPYPSNQQSSAFPFPFIFHPKYFHPMFEEMLMHWDKMFHRCGGFPFPTLFGNTTLFARDLYDFVKAWSEFSIGEPTYVLDRVLNETLDYFANSLLYSIDRKKIEQLIGRIENKNIEFEPEGSYGILALIHDISEE